jgi:hypothetical protein
MKKIIIGIHGLGNKAPKKLLQSWWKKSIKEGLKRMGYPRFFMNFKLVYWADVIYPKPLDPGEKNKKSKFYLDEPYQKLPREKRKITNKWQLKMIKFIEKKLDKIFLNQDMSINYSAITDKIIHRYFRELEIYNSTQSITNSNRLAKDVIRERLIKILKKYKKKNVMLIAHSMGSIIAYDVLSYNLPGITVNTLVTIGSPLGLPVIVHKIYREQKQRIQRLKKIKAPDSILHKWYNLSDPDDKVALDHTLSDDFKENIHHVKATDMYVYNDFKTDNTHNPHNCFGYLRADKTAEIINDFLSAKEKNWLERLTDKFKKYFSYK